MLDPAKTLALAERVAQAAEALGVRTALIGAAALAVHGYTRGTDDIDLAVAVPPETALRELADELSAAGLRTELRLPDEDDPLGGVLTIWSADDEAQTDVVEVVNFLNLAHPKVNPAVAAIGRSVALQGLRLRCVTLPDLVALKLYAGSRGDLADIVNVLAHNPDADLDAIRAAAGEFDRQGALGDLMKEAKVLRGDVPEPAGVPGP